MRIYLPSTWSGLRRLVEDGALRPQGAVGFAVTDGLRDEYPGSDEEELEYFAMQDAARASLRLVAAAGDGEPALRVVVAADAADATLTPRPDRDRAVVDVAGAVAWPSVVAVHVDGADAQDAVRAAAPIVDDAELGDDDAQFALGSAEDFALAWYAPDEVRYLIDEPR